MSHKMHLSQSLRKSGRFFPYVGAHWNCPVKIYSLNPFVSQVGFFGGPSGAEGGYMAVTSQSLRKSGRFFRRHDRRCPLPHERLGLNPFVSQVGFFQRAYLHDPDEAPR